MGVLERVSKNPNEDGPFSLNSHDASDLAFSDSFVLLRPFASVFGFRQRNDTRNVTRREPLRSLLRRNTYTCSSRSSAESMLASARLLSARTSNVPARFRLTDSNEPAPVGHCRKHEGRRHSASIWMLSGSAESEIWRNFCRIPHYIATTCEVWRTRCCAARQIKAKRKGF